MIPSHAQRRHGISTWLAPGYYAEAEHFLTSAAAAGINRLRLHVSMTDWHTPGGRNWYRWLITQANKTCSVFVALSRPMADCRDGPAPAWARQPSDYANFVTQVASLLGAHCDWLELTDPLGSSAWPDASRNSATLLTGLGLPVECRLCLGGLPLSPAWLALADDQGLFTAFQALAFRSSGTAGNWAGNWRNGLSAARRTVHDKNHKQLWLTPDQLCAASGTSGMGEELAACSQLMETSVDQIFLPSWPAEPYASRHGSYVGAQRVDGNPDLVNRLQRSGGNPALQTARQRRQIHVAAAKPDADLVFGGAGFVGCNLAARLAATGHQVVLFDNLSRPGTEINAAWLCKRYPDRVRMVLADIRDNNAVTEAIRGAKRVFHFAAQVAVTTSLDHPHVDHEINTLGTLNILEAARHCATPPPLVFTSTNKVYGALTDIPLRQTAKGYEPEDLCMRSRGINESRALAFSSPYGCSKGAADQYVLDYARTFGLPAAVLRMSCVYGPRQFGNEDQGWVAHFVRRVLDNQPITIFGDGFQVRDLLFVDDLVDALLGLSRHMPTLFGQALNVGGGPFSTTSLRGLLDRLAAMRGRMPPVRLRDWRPADQRYYVSDTTRLQGLTGWQPRVNLNTGLRQLYAWMQEHPDASYLFPRRNQRRIS